MLTEARKKDELNYVNDKIMHFAVETQKKHHSYTEVHKRLRIKGLKYRMLYPSKLRVEYQGTVTFFESSRDATDWLYTI